MHSAVLPLEQAREDHPDYPYPNALSRILLTILVITLPFTYAGTVYVGFALKIYEITTVLLFLSYLVVWATERRAQLIFQREERLTIGLACAYFIAAVVSSACGYEILNDYRTVIAIDSWRHDPMVASVLKCGYLFFDIFVFAYVLGIKGIAVEQICNWWMVGGVLAALYGWYLFIVSATGHTPLALPGQDQLQTGAPFLPQAVRSGTFMEGNHVSLYYVVSAVLALVMFCRTWLVRYALLGAFFLFSLLHTISTIGLFAGLVFLILSFLLIALSSRAGLAIAIPALLAMLVGGFCLVESSYFQTVVVYKLTDDRASMDNSLLQREDGIMAGFDMFKEHPVFGIGLSNYGYLYPYYSQFASSNDAASRGGIKEITNNIYSEVSTETGIVGSVIFFSFCAYITLLYRRSLRGSQQRVMLAGIFGVFVAWLAYPTFSILFQWVFFALAIRIFLETEDVP